VQPLLYFLQVELESPGDDLEAEIEEVAEDLLEPEPLGGATSGFLLGTRQVRFTLKLISNEVCL